MNALDEVILLHAEVCTDPECDAGARATVELDALRTDLATARQAMLDSIRSTAPLPGCGCAICKWLRGHPQGGETE